MLNMLHELSCNTVTKCSGIHSKVLKKDHESIKIRQGWWSHSPAAESRDRECMILQSVDNKLYNDFHLTIHVTGWDKRCRDQLQLSCMTLYSPLALLTSITSSLECLCVLWAKFDIGWRYITLLSIGSKDSHPSVSFILLHYSQQLSLCNGNGALTVACTQTFKSTSCIKRVKGDLFMSKLKINIYMYLRRCTEPCIGQ